MCDTWTIEYYFIKLICLNIEESGYILEEICFVKKMVSVMVVITQHYIHYTEVGHTNIKFIIL
jgi:hypothetical protein